jgi:glutamate 5-kinase
MLSKVRAAKLTTHAGIDTTIANGREPRVIERLLIDNEAIGTHFHVQLR